MNSTIASTRYKESGISELPAWSIILMSFLGTSTIILSILCCILLSYVFKCCCYSYRRKRSIPSPEAPNHEDIPSEIQEDVFQYTSDRLVPLTRPRPAKRSYPFPSGATPSPKEGQIPRGEAPYPIIGLNNGQSNEPSVHFRNPSVSLYEVPPVNIQDKKPSASLHQPSASLYEIPPVNVEGEKPYMSLHKPSASLYEIPPMVEQRVDLPSKSLYDVVALTDVQEAHHASGKPPGDALYELPPIIDSPPQSKSRSRSTNSVGNGITPFEVVSTAELLTNEQFRRRRESNY